jgi:hypothetical protein
MKTMQTTALVAIITVMTSLNLMAQFNPGSTGTNGPLNVTSNMTLDLPPDGIFNFTTITVTSGRTLTFNPNALNTPIYLLATGDVLIDGTIAVNGTPPTGSIPGAGGPGGFAGGFGGQPLNVTAGDGAGPGGGKGSAALGSYGTNYGNALLVPLIGGSGGAGRDGSPGPGGSGGGGAILIASPTKITINGSIQAVGGDIPTYWCDESFYGAGSGGGVRVVAPVVDGSGTLNTRGGLFHRSAPGCGCYIWCRDNDLRYGQAGRVRIDCLDRNAFRNLNYAGTMTRGSQMFVFPTNGVPRLDVIEAAGTAIPEGTAFGVSVDLPVGSSTNQIVRVQARNFTNDVPISVVVTPENGPSRTVQATIFQSSGNPPVAAVNVQISAGTVNRINAWTR